MLGSKGVGVVADMKSNTASGINNEGKYITERRPTEPAGCEKLISIGYSVRLPMS